MSNQELDYSTGVIWVTKVGYHYKIGSDLFYDECPIPAKVSKKRALSYLRSKFDKREILADTLIIKDQIRYKYLISKKVILSSSKILTNEGELK